MRSEQTIREELGAAQKAYQAKASGPEAEWRPLHVRVKALSAELVETLTEGAEPCEDCSGKPVGLRHLRAVIMGDKPVLLPVYEVGCSACGDKRAVGTTREAAVAAWNGSVYLPPSADRNASKAVIEAARANTK